MTLVHPENDLATSPWVSPGYSEGYEDGLAGRDHSCTDHKKAKAYSLGYKDGKLRSKLYANTGSYVPGSYKTS